MPILAGFDETHLQIKKSVVVDLEQYVLLNKRREAQYCWGKCRGLKKDGEKIKTELKKLEKFRFRDYNNEKEKMICWKK